MAVGEAGGEKPPEEEGTGEEMFRSWAYDEALAGYGPALSLLLGKGKFWLDSWEPRLAVSSLAIKASSFSRGERGCS
jgi:hypothetical protein